MEPATGYFESAHLIMDALSLQPVDSSVGAGWRGVQMCSWKGTIDVCAYEAPDDVLLVYHLGGTSRIPVATGFGQTSSISRPGLVSILHRNSAVRWEVGGEFRSLSLHISRDLFPLLPAMPTICERLKTEPRLAFNDPFISTTMDVLADEMASKRNDNGLLVESLVDALTAYIARQLSLEKPGNGDEALSSAEMDIICDYVDNSLEHQLSVDHLAQALNLTRSQFARRFQATIRQTPYQYVIERRIRIACDMLRRNKEEISEIAFCCGFSSQAHFSTTFKRLTGKSPAAFRREGRSI